jgi:hypothetical protein
MEKTPTENYSESGHNRMVDQHAWLTALIPVTLCLTGCEFVDSKVLTECRKYFPQAEILHPRREILHIQTHVGNVSGLFATKTFEAMYADHGKKLAMAASFAGYRWIILGFDDFKVVWNVRESTSFLVMSPPEFDAWARRKFDTAPPNYSVPSNTRVERPSYSHR